MLDSETPTTAGERHSGKGLDSLKTKVGPLPLWSYGVILGGMVLGIYLLKRRSSGTSTTLPTVTSTGAAGNGTFGSGGGSSSGGSTPSTTSSDPGEIAVPVTPVTTGGITVTDPNGAGGPIFAPPDQPPLGWTGGKDAQGRWLPAPGYDWDYVNSPNFPGGSGVPPPGWKRGDILPPLAQPTIVGPGWTPSPAPNLPSPYPTVGGSQLLSNASLIQQAGYNPSSMSTASLRKGGAR